MLVMIKRPWITPRSNLWSYLMMNTATDDNNNIQEKRDDEDNTDVSFTRNLHSWECNPNRWICFCIHNTQNNSSNSISMIIITSSQETMASEPEPKATAIYPSSWIVAWYYPNNLIQEISHHIFKRRQKRKCYRHRKKMKTIVCGIKTHPQFHKKIIEIP